MGHFVEVNLGFDRRVTVEYSPARLLTAPIEVAEAAIAQEEAAFMTGRFAGQVLEDVCGLLLVDALWPKPFLDHFGSRHLGRVACTYVADGRADWKFSLGCGECNGSGTTYTVSNKRVPCPDCDELGVAAEVYFETDLDGRFLKWGSGAHIDVVLNYGSGGDAPRLVVRPEAEALAMVAGWWL